MGTNTVLLSIDDYNELRDFKREVERSRGESKYAVINYGLLIGKTEVRYYTDSEIVSDFERRIKKLEEKNESLEAEKREIQKMSFWDLYRWVRKAREAKY